MDIVADLLGPGGPDKGRVLDTIFPSPRVIEEVGAGGGSGCGDGKSQCLSLSLSAPRDHNKLSIQ
jgi:hypothetical protein